MIAYASRTGTRRNLAALRRAGWRLLVTAGAVLRSEGFPYALDNGAWGAHQRGQAIDLAQFRAALDKMGGGADWVVAPDIVCGGVASLALSLEWLPYCLTRCQRVLIAVQDGMTADDLRPHLSARVGLFVGGSTEWKLASMPGWGALAAEVGCWLHVGRVNSARRISLCAAHGVTSFDGTSATRFSKTLPRLDAARRQMALAEQTHGGTIALTPPQLVRIGRWR